MLTFCGKAVSELKNTFVNFFILRYDFELKKFLTIGLIKLKTFCKFKPCMKNIGPGIAPGFIFENGLSIDT
jgi:hypothetical protein